ncbi:MAG: ATP-binding protein [Pseudomonadota bacterium]|nr:ATP-binding protein [Pseudomonadota bacterium]
MNRPGIRRRLVLLLSVSVALVWAGMLAWSYVATREEVAEQADARLEEGARTIMLLDLPKLAALASTPPGDDADDDDDEGGDALQLRFQVWDRAGTLRLRSRGAPNVGFKDDTGHAMIGHHRYNWHTYAMRDKVEGYQVRVFERPGVRGKLVDETAQQMAQVLLVGLPLLALLAWISIGVGLRPLRQVSAAIALRDAGKLDPIDLAGTPVEVQPLVDALNRLLLRLAGSMAHERAFTADAAHELRTPLAAIKIQAEVALAAVDAQERSHAMRQIIQGVNRTTHLVRQLLLLARLDQPAIPTPRQPVDLGQLAADSAARYAGAALDKEMALALDAAPGCIVHGDPVALAVMVDNLIDNAVKYGSANGKILVLVRPESTGPGPAPALAVLGDGPAVDPAIQARLRDRFYRAEGNAAEGSGLGLSIVDKIAQAYGGVLMLGPGLHDGGFGATVRFFPADAEK